VPSRYLPQVVVSVLVVIVLSGGALYAARVSESAPRVVSSAWLEEVEDNAEGSLMININTADVDELDELPQVGPATAESIVEYRRTNGMFRSVDELEGIPGIGSAISRRSNPLQRSRTEVPVLDLKPPVRLDGWAITLAGGIAGGTVVPLLAPMLVVASAIVSVGALLWRSLVPAEWRLMAILGPLFVVGGVGISSLHAATPDPLAELAALEPGEVIVVGRVASPPVPSSWGYRADVRVEHLWYEGREVLRGGGVEVFAGDLVASGWGTWSGWTVRSSSQNPAGTTSTTLDTLRLILDY